MSGHRRPSINVFPHSYPPADKPARSETTTRYQSGVPPVRWGDVSRPSSSVMADASIFDPFRAAHAAAGDLGPPESAFDIRTQAYKRQENRGALAREAYWQHNFAHDPQTSGFRYHIKGISYAQNALVQTREYVLSLSSSISRIEPASNCQIEGYRPTARLWGEFCWL